MARSRIAPIFHEHPDNPLPPNGSAHEIEARDGYRLRVGIWVVPKGRLHVPEPAWRTAGAAADTGAAPVAAAAAPDQASASGTEPDPPGERAEGAEARPAAAAAEPGGTEGGGATPRPATAPAAGATLPAQAPAPEAAGRPRAEPGEDGPVPTIEARGTVLVLNGRTEFIEKYAEVAGELVDRGFCVAVLDWRGQGGSERLIKGNPKKGHVDDIDSYVLDLLALLDFVESTNCPAPYFALAHSTGGQVLLRAVPLVADRIARAVVTSAFLRLKRGRVPGRLIDLGVGAASYLGLGELLAPGAGSSSINTGPFEGNALTSDPGRYARAAAVIARYRALEVGGPTIGWVYAALRSAREILRPEFIARINMPILMLSASEDTVVSSRTIADFATYARTVMHISVPGSRHEIMMERDEIRQQFWAAFDAFIPGSD